MICMEYVERKMGRGKSGEGEKLKKWKIKCNYKNIHIFLTSFHVLEAIEEGNGSRNFLR